MCLITTPVVQVGHSHTVTEGWLQVPSLDLTTRAADYFPITATPLQFDSMFTGINEWAKVSMFQLREYYASGSGIDLAMIWHLYATAAPTSPVLTLGTTYDAPLGNWIGKIEITNADYTRLNGSNRIVTITDPDRLPYIKNGSTAVNSIFAVPQQNNDAYDYAANAEVWARIKTIQLG